MRILGHFYDAIEQIPPEDLSSPSWLKTRNMLICSHVVQGKSQNAWWRILCSLDRGPTPSMPFRENRRIVNAIEECYSLIVMFPKPIQKDAMH